MSRLGFFLLWVLAIPGLAPAASTPKAPLQLDNDSWGDLILYDSGQGTYTNVYYDLAPAERFVYVNGQWPRGVGLTPARLNADQRNDVFLYDVATGAYALALNNGSTYTLVTGIWSPGWVIHAAEFNRDGLHDLLLYNPSTGQWFQCFNDRSSGFTYNSGTWATGRTLTLGDFNGDGRSDVFAYDRTSGQWFQALASSSGLGFATDRTGTWDAEWESQAVTLNNDDFTDLFLYNRTTGIWVQCVSTNDSRVFRFTSGTWTPGWRVFPTDFDGDRRADVLVYNARTGIRVQCLNTGNGTFEYRSGTWATGLTIAGNIDRVVPPPPPPPTMPALAVSKILAFGDSLTYGSHSSRNFFLAERDHVNYPSHLAALLQARYPNQTITVVNGGMPGEYAAFAQPRLESAIAANSPDLVLLMEGTNDINAGIPPMQIAGYLNRLSAAALAKGAYVRIAKLPPILSDSTGTANTLVLLLNQQITSIAATQPIGTPVDVYALLSRDPALMGNDGLHPSDAGYQAIARAFFDVIVASFHTLR